MKVKTVEHLRELTSLQLIGVLPMVKDSRSDRVIVEEAPNSAIAEAFRSFRTNLQLQMLTKKTALI